MSVRKWRGFGLSVAMIALVSPLAHAEGGRPSRQTLDQMGLGGMVVMSDDEAMAVRGQGYGGGGGSYMPKPPKDGGSMVQVFGNSSASISIKDGGAHSENGYTAKGPHYAAGANGSFAGVVYTNTSGKGGKGNGGYGQGMGNGSMTSIHSTVVFAGGFSFGKAF